MFSTEIQKLFESCHLTLMKETGYSISWYLRNECLFFLGSWGINRSAVTQCILATLLLLRVLKINIFNSQNLQIFHVDSGTNKPREPGSRFRAICLFVPRSDSFPMNQEKKDTHFLYLHTMFPTRTRISKILREKF